MLTLSSDQMNGTSWGCEGVFLWCYGSVRMFVMWQEVVNVWGWRVLSDDGSWRNHVWAESGRGMGEEEIKQEAKERKRGAFTQQTGLPSPSSYPCIHPPTVGNIDLRGAVNGSGMESVCCEGSRRVQPCDTTNCGSARILKLYHTSFAPCLIWQDRCILSILHFVSLYLLLSTDISTDTCWDIS